VNEKNFLERFYICVGGTQKKETRGTKSLYWKLFVVREISSSLGFI
jgi:hypothetical protein